MFRHCVECCAILDTLHASLRLFFKQNDFMLPCISLAESLNVVKRKKVAHEPQKNVSLIFFHPSVCVPIDYGQ